MPNTQQLIGLILALLLAVVVLGVLARRLSIPYPILFVVGGLVLGLIPGLPTIPPLNPDLVLFLFLPPLVYGDAWFTSWREFHANLRTIVQLAVALVLVTMVVVAVVAHAFIPALSLAAAFVLGAIVSPTDTVAASTIAGRLGVPRRITTIIEGESLVNDATALVLYSFAVAAVTTGSFSLPGAILQFVIVIIGSIGIGFIVGWLAIEIERRMDDPPIETTLSFLVPFVAYLPAQALHLSGVLAVVVAGLYAGRRESSSFSANARLQAENVWTTLVFVLNGFIFILIGLQLRSIAENALVHESLGALILYGVIISAAVICARLAWIFPASYLRPALLRRIVQRRHLPRWRNVTIIGWTGIRGVVSLAVALALPRFPGDSLIKFLTFCVILATLLLQGLSLPWLIRLLGLHDDGTSAVEEVDARLQATNAALARIEELAQSEATPEESVNRLRSQYEARLRGLTARARRNHKDEEDTDADDASKSDGDAQQKVAALGQLKREIIQAQRDAVIKMRNEGDISDDVLHRIERDLDLDELRIKP